MKFDDLWDYLVSVSLRSIIHSYAPGKIMSSVMFNQCFRLLTEYYSFLSYGQKSLLLQYFFKVLSCNIFIFEISLFISVKNIFNSSFFRYYPITIFFSNLEFYILYPSIFYPIFQEIKTI